MVTRILWATFLLSLCSGFCYAGDQIWWEWQILANGRASDYLGNTLAMGRYTNPGDEFPDLVADGTAPPAGPNAVLGMSHTAYLSASSDKRLFAGSSPGTLEMPLTDYEPVEKSAKSSASPVIDLEIQSCVAVSMKDHLQISLLTTHDSRYGRELWLPQGGDDNNDHWSTVEAPDGCSDFGRSVHVVDTTIFVGGRDSAGNGIVTSWHVLNRNEPATSWVWTRAGDVTVNWDSITNLGVDSSAAAVDFGQVVAVDISVDRITTSMTFVDSLASGAHCTIAVASPASNTVYIYSGDSVSALMTSGINEPSQVLSQPSGLFGTALAVGRDHMLFVGAPNAPCEDSSGCAHLDSGAVFQYQWQAGSGLLPAGFVLIRVLYPEENSSRSYGFALDNTWRFADSSKIDSILIVGAPLTNMAETWFFPAANQTSNTLNSSDTTLVSSSEAPIARLGRMSSRRGPGDPVPVSDYQFGHSVAIGAGPDHSTFFMAGSPGFNANRKISQYSIGSIMVGILCGEGKYVFRGPDRGVSCKTCPAGTKPSAQETHSVWQSSSCTCAGIPSHLPANAYITNECTVKCTAGFNYDLNANNCDSISGNNEWSSNHPGTHPTMTGESGAMVWLVIFAGLLPMLWCCWCLKRVVSLRHRQLRLTQGQVQQPSFVIPAPPRVNLDRLPIITKEATQCMAIDVSDCSICLCEFEDDDKIRMLPCSHPFHQPCIDQWLENNTTCPLCMRSLLETPSRPVERPEVQEVREPTAEEAEEEATLARAIIASMEDTVHVDEELEEQISMENTVQWAAPIVIQAPPSLAQQMAHLAHLEQNPDADIPALRAAVLRPRVGPLHSELGDELVVEIEDAEPGDEEAEDASLMMHGETSNSPNTTVSPDEEPEYQAVDTSPSLVDTGHSEL